MPQEQHLRRVATMSISSLSIARRPVQQRNRAQELLAIRAELAEARMSLCEEKARSARLERSASQLAVTQLATAGHDLRDPLQVIASHVDLIALGFCGAVNPDQRARLEHVRAQVDHLSAVVSSVLMLASVSHRGGMLELSDVPVAELLRQVRDLVEPLATPAGVSLVVDLERAPTIVRAERNALVRVLVNLAANGIKATPRGGRVALRATALTEAVELRVVDSGPGIPADQLDAILEPFVQIQTTTSMNARGCGLGLTIARDLTRMMGGELLVHSVVGVGSAFTVRFPGSLTAAEEGATAFVSKAA